ncbi:hypothetical protein K431DRAFT_282733 [Polychaeton citri CBS 116435]|uniref:Extracellular membrane protein CFEM domain-containing protein n=1 Tax=Polychaeton citri CBS 116435 TaxID=1314669 RepID=A0A9P4QC17_9PEZI|nr:hypothetical protein K431DRAFT_282733 [Polychaeton citri CBS 116435]
MRYSVSALVLALPAFTYAVSLNDFPPRLTDLPSACKSVYTQQIDGCGPSDFGGGPCSTACVHGLDDLTRPILRNCQGVSGQNIIAAFLAGDGPTSVCTNANAVLSGGNDDPPQSQSQSQSKDSSSHSSTASRLSPTSSMTSEVASPSATISSSSSSSRQTATSALASPETPSSTTATPVEASGTATASSFASATSGLLVDTSSAPSGAHTQAATASQTTELSPQESLMKDGSGGGSPFDSTGNLSNAAGKCIDLGASLPTTVAIAIAAGFLMYFDCR